MKGWLIQPFFIFIRMSRQTLPRQERLKSGRDISALFENGASFLVYPVKVVWYIHENPEKNPTKVAFTVSKKIFRHAVQRNLLKRRMREAYRLNKQLLLSEDSDFNARIVFVYIAKEELNYSVIARSITAALKKVRMMGREKDFG